MRETPTAPCWGRRVKNVRLRDHLILLGTADRSAARIPCRQALQCQAAEAAVPLAGEVTEARAVPVVLAEAEVVPVA